MYSFCEPWLDLHHFVNNILGHISSISCISALTASPFGQSFLSSHRPPHQPVIQQFVPASTRFHHQIHLSLPCPFIVFNRCFSQHFLCNFRKCSTCSFIHSLLTITGIQTVLPGAERFANTSSNLAYCTQCSQCCLLYQKHCFVEWLRSVCRPDPELLSTCLCPLASYYQAQQKVEDLHLIFNLGMS